MNELTKHRQTALHLAAQQDLPTICSVLLENAVDFAAVDENGNNGGCPPKCPSSGNRGVPHPGLPSLGRLVSTAAELWQGGLWAGLPWTVLGSFLPSPAVVSGEALKSSLWVTTDTECMVCRGCAHDSILGGGEAGEPWLCEWTGAAVAASCSKGGCEEAMFPARILGLPSKRFTLQLCISRSCTVGSTASGSS